MSFRIGSAPAAPPRRPIGAKNPNRPQPPPAPPPPFDQLQAFKWRTVDLPLVSIRVSLVHDLADHEYYGVDIADVEATGRKSLQIEATLPFFNGIVPGKAERWTAGLLYPVVFRQFLKAFVDSTTGPLIHPELGSIQCKPHELRFELDPKRRDGVEVSATWRETLADGVDQTLAKDPSMVRQLSTAAADLDASQADLLALFKDYMPPAMTESFASLAGKLTGDIDSVTTAKNLAAGMPGRFLYQVGRVETALKDLGNPISWPVKDACQRAKEASHGYASQVGKGSRMTRRYKTPTKMTVSGVARAIGAKVDDLIKLNPLLVANPEIPEGTIVRYYG